MIIKYFNNEYNLITKELDNQNIYNHLLSRKSFGIKQQKYQVNTDLYTNIKNLYNLILKSKIYPNFYKLWIYNDLEEFIATLEFNQRKEIIYYNPKDLKSKQNYNNLSYNKFITWWLLKNWGTFGHGYYKTYGELPNILNNDLFFAQKLINKLETIYSKHGLSYNYGDEIFEPLLNTSKNIIDNLFGNIFEQLNEELVVYRKFGLYSNKERNKNYNGWVSITTNKNYIEDTCFEPFILPKGFSIIDTNNLCDEGELIVRNEDLVKF